MTARHLLTDDLIRALCDHWQRTGQTTWPRPEAKPNRPPVPLVEVSEGEWR